MTTTDGFLGGRVTLTQPARGYRAGVDAVLLAAACPARAGDAVLELGCGVGAAALCLAARVPVRLVGVELQPAYAELARQNAAANGADFEVVTADLRALPAELRQRSFDQIIANPPYYDRAQGTAAADEGRDTALGGDTPLANWMEVAAKRLRPKGHLTMIQRIERLPEMLAHMPAPMGAVQVLPIAARAGRAPHLALLRARKEGRAPFTLCANLIMHAGEFHEKDGIDYMPEVQNILRDGAALAWPN